MDVLALDGSMANLSVVIEERTKCMAPETGGGADEAVGACEGVF